MLRHLIRKEFLQIRRNSFLPRLIVMFPIMIMCIMPWVMNQEVRNIRVVVVDSDRTPSSQRLVRQIEASRYFIFQGQAPSYSEALRLVEHSQTDVVMEVRDGRVLIAANAVDGTKGAMGSAYLAQIALASHTEGPSLNSVAAGSSACSVLTLYNKQQSYKRFMIPALLAIVVMLMCGFLPALNIVGEKESGTIEQMNVTPVPRLSFILAKLIPYWLIALFVITVCLLLSWLLYGITCQGPLALVYLLAMLLALFFSSFGLIISNYSDTLQQAIFVMWFFVVCLLLLSGLFTPVRSMPFWSYLTTYVNPMHYFIDAVRTVFLRGGGLSAIARQVLALVLIGLTMAAWAVKSYKKNG
ncbi:MAG: ABC transporter permease [Bacteroidaceae bacterium]|nr:ABC transporter permease [Bacteroidaceae bacterium]